MSKQKFYFLLFTLVTAAITVFAREAPRNEWQIFQESKKIYLAGNYERAQQFFEAFIKKFPESRLLTANLLMLAKTKYKRGNYRESLKDCESFIDRFPNSTYVDDIYFLMAINYYRLNRIETAVTTWLYVAGNNNDARLSIKALNLARDAMRYLLDIQSLEHLSEEFRDGFAKSIVQYYLAERYYERNNIAGAVLILEKILKDRKFNPDYYDKAQQLYDYLKDKKGKAIRIAALLPLSGQNASVGRALLDGAQVAVDEYNKMHDIPVEIAIYDYQTKLLTALDMMKNIARDPSINAVFGPVENDIAAACAVISDYERITLISPTSSTVALANLSEFFFQLRAPVEVLAGDLAKFGYDSLQIRRVVTFAPIEDYFIGITEAFKEQIEESGGEVFTEQWYYPGDQNFSKQFRKLKRIGLKLSFQDSVMQADSSYTLAQIDSMYKSYKAEERLRLEENQVKVDSADIPVTAFDGIFMPIYKDDINFIAPQFTYANIQAQILGNADWYDPDALKKNKNYVNGLIFISDGYLDEESWDYRQFRNTFRNRYKETPEKFDLIGYDSFGFILSAVNGNPSAASRTKFRDLLKQANDYGGIYRSVKIGRNNYNTHKRILKYSYGELFPLN